jgi:hypothetical protein
MKEGKDDVDKKPTGKNNWLLLPNRANNSPLCRVRLLRLLRQSIKLLLLLQDDLHGLRLNKARMILLVSLVIQVPQNQELYV